VDCFTPTERAELLFWRWLVLRGRLLASEWAVRTPDGRRVGLAYDERLGPPNAADALYPIGGRRV
jgi:hypothetical protein